MKVSVDIKSASNPKWIEAVMNNFDSFLQDHADCERKASAFAMMLVARYPNRLEMIPELIETAVEELEHFQDVYKLMQSRGIQLQHKIEKDFYVIDLQKEVRKPSMEKFLDTLCIGSIVECRGAERFRLISEALEDVELKKFYKMLWTTEAKHGNIYVEFALNYFSKDEVYARLDELLDKEAEILANLPIQARLH